MQKSSWLLCPVCRNKTRLKIRTDTVLQNFPLYCPKCKHETLVNVSQSNISVINEPDAQTQSRQPREQAQGYRLRFSARLCNTLYHIGVKNAEKLLKKYSRLG